MRERVKVSFVGVLSISGSILYPLLNDLELCPVFLLLSLILW